MNQDGTIELFHYWNRLRAGRPAPLRTEIEPADIRTLLADTFILERDRRRAANFRLAGTRLCSTYGKELKKTPFPDLWREKDRTLVGKLVQACFHDGSVVVVTFTGRTARERENLFEMLLLPLGSHDESPRLLGAVLPVDRPFWLMADPIVENRIDTLRLVDADREPLFLADRPAVAVPPLAPDETAILAPGDQLARRIRHLVVLEGGKRS